MEQKVKNFTRLVFAIHLLLLAAVITGVFFASKEVYEQTRAQALRQAANAQELLAAQTVDGIESFYASIRNDLDLIHRADTEEGAATQPTGGAQGAQPTTRPTIGGFPLPLPFRQLSDVSTAGRPDRIGNVIGLLLWRQLEGRASLLFGADADRIESNRESPVSLQKNPPVRAIGPIGSHKEAQKVVNQMRGWLKQVDQPSVSSFQEIPELGDGNVVCVPAPGRPGERERRLLVAFVPIDRIREQFLEKLNPKDDTTAASLADERMVTMVSSDAKLVGVDARKAEDPQVRQLAEQAARSDKPVTIYIEQPYKFGGTIRQPRMMTMVPVDVLGKRWFLMISSRLSTVDEVVSHLFRRALYWAVAVGVAMTAILVSTGAFLIRSRARLERVRHEVLTKEMTQAREIQKAWLPQAKFTTPHVDVSAVNHPASHISGDFYNWFELPDKRLAVTIGDVTGHGMSAAFLMATTQLVVRTTMTRVGGDPGLCLEEVNRQLCTQIFVGQFVTMVVVVIDLARGELQVATAGHYPPLLGTGDGFAPLDMEPELVLGVDPATEYRTNTYALPPRASLLMYTDGVLDAEGADGKRFGRDGLRRALRGGGGAFASAQAIVDHLVADVDRFRDRKALPDDLTLVAVQLSARAATPARRPPAAAVVG